MINRELIVDNFAGGGGASTGIELATGKSESAGTVRWRENAKHEDK